MNKLNFIVLFLLAPFVSFSQLSENFSDGLFYDQNRMVKWTGDVNKFIVNESLQLQLNASGAESPAQLRTSSTLSANASWEWWMKMDFNPSGSNYAKVFLCSDENDLAGELNGLFVRVGYTDKNVCLMHSQKGKNNTTLIKGTVKRLDNASVSLSVKAILDKNGNFSLYSKLDDEPDYVLEGSCNFSQIIDSKVFGIICYFTVTRSKLFYFDDFLVRELDNDNPDPDPDPDPGDDALYEGDVIFSEIMANPGGDNPEYVELYNASDKSFDLKNCLYYYGDKSYKLPEGIINPDDYFVLTKTTATGNFPTGVKVFGVSSFPTMANTGKLLMFSTDKEDLISWFEYSDKMYGSNDKKLGGWSLECIDYENRSNTALNWIASDEAGGTPGRANSVKRINPDTEIPKVTSIQMLENNEMKLVFSKPMNRQTLLAKSSFEISDNQYTIENLQTSFPQGTELTIRFSALPPQGELIEFELEGVKDLSDFGLDDKKVMVGSGHEAAPNEIIINEILFNPPAGGDEYVEIYNNSDKTVDLQFLSFTSRKPSDGSFNKLYPLAEKATLFHPGEYLVITKSKDLVCQFFNCRSESFFVELSVMPSLANTSGCAVLVNNKTSEVVNEFAYHENMHTAGISSKKGISLERIDFNRPANDASNWCSASADSGFGTPGYQNSQQSDQTGIEDISIIYPEFSADNYFVQYRLDKPGYRCRVFVYDALGRCVYTIANNELLGTEGKLLWNGKGNSNQLLLAGIYIIYMEVYNMNGNVKRFRKPVVVK
jgi:hypothetical protein